MAAIISGPLGVDISVVNASTPDFALGERVEMADGDAFVYIEASAAIDQYDLVVIDESIQAQAATTAVVTNTKPGKGGVAQVAIASGSFGWVQVKGRGTVNVLANCAADVKLYTSATAGHADDTAGSNALCAGLRIDTTAGGSAEAEPFSAAIDIAFNAS